MVKITKNEVAIVGIIFSLVIMINIPVNPLKQAFALQPVQITPTTTPILVANTSFNGLYYTVHIGSNAGQPYLSVYNTTNYQFLTQYNLTASIGFTSGLTAWGLDCSPNTALCVITYKVNTHPWVVFLVDIYHGYIQTNSLQFSSSYTSMNAVYVSTIGAQDQIFVIYQDTTNVKINNYIIPVTTGLSQFQTMSLILSYTYNTGFAGSIATLDFKRGLFNTTNSAQSTQQFLGFTSASNNLFVVINIGSRTTQCSLALGGGTSTGAIYYMNDTSNGINNVNGLDWIVSSGSLNTFYKIDNNCNIKTTYDSSTLIGTGYKIAGLSGSPTRHEIYATLLTKNQLIVVNETTIGSNGQASWVTGQYGIDSPLTNNIYDNIVSSITSNGVVTIAENPREFWLYWVSAGSSTNVSSGQTNTCNSSSSIPHCIGDVNCDLPANVNLAMCVSGYQLNPVKGNSQLISTGVNNILVSAGLINGSNTNIKTNGTGYILLIVAILITTALMLYATKMVLQVPLFVWMFLYLIIVALGVILQWVDITFFILGVIVMIALASGKIKSFIAGETTIFGG